jgi:hypothetical protein
VSDPPALAENLEAIPALSPGEVDHIVWSDVALCGRDMSLVSFSPRRDLDDLCPRCLEEFWAERTADD